MPRAWRHALQAFHLFFVPFKQRRTNAYDGEEEFWVTIRETATKTEEHSWEEEHRKRSQAMVCVSLSKFHRAGRGGSECVLARHGQLRWA